MFDNNFIQELELRILKPNCLQELIEIENSNKLIEAQEQ